jgi:sialate O-acetylesterase
VLGFEGVNERLSSLSGDRALAFELCGATQESCRWAQATARSSTVRIADDGLPATRVRFGWGESPVVNLFDESGLPPGPFEVAIE